MSLIDSFGSKTPAQAPKAAVGANPNIAQLMAGTANACAPSGCDSAPPVAVGLILKTDPQGGPIPFPYNVPAGGKASLVVALDVDFKGDDLMLASDLDPANPDPDGLKYLQVTSWASNGIRDQNLLAETGIGAIAFDIRAMRRFGFDTAPTAARQQIVIEITNVDPLKPHTVQGLIAGTCGDCNTTRRGQ
jgi:hypothetical protein